MKVFISWSGLRSKAVAELLREWLGKVTSDIELWISTHDIDRGAQWFGAINEELSTSSQGIICLTRDNKVSPWLLYEAGSLSKGLSTSRIYTLLIDLNTQDLDPPLSQFNHTFPTQKESMLDLIRTINNSLEVGKLRENHLLNIFDANWAEFESAFAEALEATQGSALPEVRKDIYDIVVDVLDTVRNLEKRTVETERLAENNYPKLTSGNMGIQLLSRRMLPSMKVKLNGFTEETFTNLHYEELKSHTMALLPEVAGYYGKDIFEQAFTTAIKMYFAEI